MEKIWKVTLSNWEYEDRHESIYLFSWVNKDEIVTQVKNYFNTNKRNNYLIWLKFQWEKEIYYAGNYVRKSQKDLSDEYADLSDEYWHFINDDMTDTFWYCDPCYTVSIDEIEVNQSNFDKVNRPSLYRPKNEMEYELLAPLNREEKDIVANWLSFDNNIYKSENNGFIIEIEWGQALDNLIWDYQSVHFIYDFTWMKPRLNVI